MVGPDHIGITFAYCAFFESHGEISLLAPGSKNHGDGTSTIYNTNNSDHSHSSHDT